MSTASQPPTEELARVPNTLGHTRMRAPMILIFLVIEVKCFIIAVVISCTNTNVAKKHSKTYDQDDQQSEEDSCDNDSLALKPYAALTVNVKRTSYANTLSSIYMTNPNQGAARLHEGTLRRGRSSR